MAQNEYLIFLDESEARGAFYSNFYGGVIVGSSQYERITQLLNQKKKDLNFFGEVKWSKVSEPYVDRYIALIQVFFAEFSKGHLRARIMFRQNAHQPQNLTKEQIQGEYFMLYYQFVKHAFGLLVMPVPGHDVNLRLFFDDLPDKEEKRSQFKSYILALASNDKIRARDIILKPENIHEVDSHNHVLLQCIDIVLGAMAFRLNDKHLEKIPGKRTRGKKTIAKEKLYKAIHAEICKLKPNFNAGISTGSNDPAHGRWFDPYTHWRFVPRDASWNSSLTKAKCAK